MHIKASTRTRLTTSLFSTTFLIAILTVAAPQLVGCPATPSHLGADDGSLSAEDRKRRSGEDKTGASILDKLDPSNKHVVVVDRKE